MDQTDTSQRQAALAGAAANRALARLKRDLKHGRIGLAEALCQPVAANRSVLELLGYAIIGTGPRHDRVSAQQPGRHALRLARFMSPPVTHLTRVNNLTGRGRSELCLALDVWRDARPRRDYAAAAKTESQAA